MSKENTWLESHHALIQSAESESAAGEISDVQPSKLRIAGDGTGANPRLLSPVNSPHSLVSLKITPARRTPN
ncbi:MAG TPA: hypothetical protein VER68_11330, partial [Azonexus sp.]|nr:hypothetical protein [Azonexus sp.]